MQIRHWLQCPLTLTHGNIIKREIFSKKTPDTSANEGATLDHIDSFSRCYLESRIASVPATFENRQLIFYIVDGKGVFEVGDMEREVQEGDGIIVPPGLSHTLTNQLDVPLEFLILEEIISEEMELVRQEAIVRNYRETPLNQGHWTHLVHPLFGVDDGLIKTHAILVVRIEAMQTPDTHGHDSNIDEVWYMLKGNGIHIVSQNVYRQRPGDAVSVAPSNPGHSLI